MTAADELPTDEHAGLWLTPDQLASWLSVVRLITRLPWAIDAQLQRDAGLSMIEYMTMAMLGEAPQWTMRMSDLAERTSSSLSRLSHLVTRLENRGYVRREADPADGRFTNAILLPAGLAQDGVGRARSRGIRPPAGHRQLVPRAAAPGSARMPTASSGGLTPRHADPRDVGCVAGERRRMTQRGAGARRLPTGRAASRRRGWWRQPA